MNTQVRALSAVVIIALAVACTPQQASAVAPGASCVAAVIADAIQGMGINEILQKEKGSCVQDVEEVIAILLGSGDPHVQATLAYRAARSIRAAQQMSGGTP